MNDPLREDESTLADSIRQSIARQHELLARGDIDALQEQAAQCEPLIARLNSLAKGNARPQTLGDLADRHARLRTAVAAHLADIASQLRKLQKGRSTLGVYGRHV